MRNGRYFLVPLLELSSTVGRNARMDTGQCWNHIKTSFASFFGVGARGMASIREDNHWQLGSTVDGRVVAAKGQKAYLRWWLVTWEEEKERAKGERNKERNREDE